MRLTDGCKDAGKTPGEAGPFIEHPVDAATPYERRQSFNALTSWLHSIRYRHVFREFLSLERELGRTIRVVEIGCGYGKLFSVLRQRFDVSYTGIDISGERVSRARARYGSDDRFAATQGSALEVLRSARFDSIDVVVALETLEHIPEHDVVRLVERVSALAPRRFICSVPIEIGPSIWLKNVGSFLSGYVRHREYSWRETFWVGLYCLDKLPPHGTGHKGFDWRWLAQTIRHNMRVNAILRLPLRILPFAVSTNVLIVSTPRDQPPSGPGRVRSREHGALDPGEEQGSDGDVLPLPRGALAPPAHDERGGESVRVGETEDVGGEAVQEGGKCDDVDLEGAACGREPVPG